MIINNNPFLSDKFIAVWIKHFTAKKKRVTFKSVELLSFIKPTYLPLYINIGKTNTKGINYILNNINSNELKRKVLLIYDFPTYITQEINSKSTIKFLKSKQYPGFLINLEKFKSLNEYMSATFSKSSRYKLNKYKKRLENSFDIKYEVYYGSISKDHYLLLFEKFHSLLTKRFEDKQITNNNLDPIEWEFYKEVTFPLILDKQASLFVIYDHNTPIAITLNFISKELLFDAITVFDIDYSKFHIGSITIMKQIEWCLENDFAYFDFSKGDFDYKRRWCTTEYKFEYHIIYDAKSILASLLAYSIYNFYRFKNYLREKNINTLFHKMKFLLHKKENNPVSQQFKIQNYNYEITYTNFQEIDIYDDKYIQLKLPVFEYLYLNNEEMKNIKIYKNIENANEYLIESKKETLELKIIQYRL
tara:strand:+ start:22545 stop:23798 length:1254 start_codon:yes stop_codon:yes gene_type:complete